MTTTNGITGTQAPAGSAQAPSSANGLKADTNTFLKLLVANLQHQDPMQPQDSSSYMQQLSSMTMVQELTSLADTTTSAANDQKAATAIGLLGRNVSYIDNDGNRQTGTVDSVQVATGGNPSLTVAGIAGIQTAQVTQVA
jgi:flagellar basal-body rod modification protein FlgD